MGHLAPVVRAPALPHGRSRRRDCGRRGKIAFDAGTAHLWPRAIWRYNALHTYRKTVLRRAARLGMSSACGLLRSRSRRPSPPPSAPAPRGTAVAAAPATPQSLLADDAIAFAPAAADDVAHGIADRRLVSLLALGSAQRHGIVVSMIKTGSPRS